MTDPTETVAAYLALCSRAIAVVEGAPYWQSVDREDWVRVCVDNGTATLHHFEIGYDSPVLDADTCEFPVSLLTMSDDDFASWKAEQRRIYDEQQKQETAAAKQAAAAAAEARDRAEYERLKGKFEPSTTNADCSNDTKDYPQKKPRALPILERGPPGSRAR